MEASTSSGISSQREQFTEHFASFTEAQRKAMADLYKAKTPKAEDLVAAVLADPERVRTVARREIKGGMGWRIVEQVTVEHDLGCLLDWGPAKARKALTRLGLAKIEMAEGQPVAVMPGPMAAIFAGETSGVRGSMALLLGRASAERVAELAEIWGVSTAGSKEEQILDLIDRFVEPSFIDELLETLPTPDWLGDALMVMELGGVSYWQQIYSYDVDGGSDGDAKVVPLMRNEDREGQRSVAELLMKMGVLFRVPPEDDQPAMLTVPEELWMGVWQVGVDWMLDWTAQASMGLRDQALGRRNGVPPAGLQPVIKWLLAEAAQGRLRWQEEGISEESVEVLSEVVRDGEADLVRWWQLGAEGRLIGLEPDGGVKPGERLGLLEKSRGEFARELLLGWCLGSFGGMADQAMGVALGLDQTFLKRALRVYQREGHEFPLWFLSPGLESGMTGGGWLREEGTGTDGEVVFESQILGAFVMQVKLTFLDIVSLLEPGRYYPVRALSEVLQSIGGLISFLQLRVVLENQPPAIYLPFQRTSFLMDPTNLLRFEEWVEELADEVLIPLGVAAWDEKRESLWLETGNLRVPTPEGLPAEHRGQFLGEIFDEEVPFEVPEERPAGLREVAPVVDSTAREVSLQVPLAAVLEATADREILEFDLRAGVVRLRAREPRG